jgi:putative endonuclease
MQALFYTYILECADKTYYTGWTNDLDKRLSVHNQGKGSKYTRARLPVKLVKSWSFDTKSGAMKFEHEIKSMSRKDKLALCGERNA